MMLRPPRGKQDPRETPARVVLHLALAPRHWSTTLRRWEFSRAAATLSLSASCLLTAHTQTRARTHTHTRARTHAHARARTHTHACTHNTHARRHTHTHTHTHILQSSLLHFTHHQPKHLRRLQTAISHNVVAMGGSGGGGGVNGGMRKLGGVCVKLALHHQHNSRTANRRTVHVHKPTF